MQFKDYLATFPAVDHLVRIEIINQQGHCVHTIPAVEGKLGSLKLYNALAEQFSNQLNAESATQGLIWFAEHLADAKQHPTKHPNIDLLIAVEASGEMFEIKRILR